MLLAGLHSLGWDHPYVLLKIELVESGAEHLTSPGRAQDCKL